MFIHSGTFWYKWFQGGNTVLENLEGYSVSSILHILSLFIVVENVFCPIVIHEMDDGSKHNLQQNHSSILLIKICQNAGII